jgi:hypothetical protein
MSQQSDFLAEKSALQNLIEENGHMCMFYLEFNFIEMYWGATKKYMREHCNYSWKGLQETLPKGLDSIETNIIRKFARKSWRYIQLYRIRLFVKLAEYAVKKFKFHHHIPQDILNQFLIENI